MMKKLTNKIVDWLISCDVINEEDSELYNYALFLVILSFSPIVISLVIGLCMGLPLQSILIMIPFFVIRQYSGGYHAKSLSFCFFISCIIIAVFIFLSGIISFHFSIGISACSFLIIFLFSPITNENKKLNIYEFNRYKLLARIISGIFLLLDIVFTLLEIETFSICISIGLAQVAFLQIIAIIKNNITKIV